MIRSLAVVLTWTFAGPALAQAGAQPYAPPPAPPVQPAPTQAQPIPGPPGTGAATTQAQPTPAPQGTGSVATQPQAAPSPGATGGASQQVVVNPQPPPPAPGSVNVQTAPARSAAGSADAAPLSVEHRGDTPALETVAIDAGYGALAGALVGGGIALIDQGNNLGRNLLVGAGAGILVGAAIGGFQAYGASRSSYAMDGLGSTDRDPPLASARTVVSYAGRF